MESAAYSSKDGLCVFLRKFLPANSQDTAHTLEDKDASGQVEEVQAERIQGVCVYCGVPLVHMPVDIGGLQDNICPLCKEGSVCQRGQFYQTVDETIRNMKYMCSILWNTSIRVKNCRELTEPGSKAAKAWKKPTTWAANLEPQFVQAEMDDARNMCTFKIRTAIPVGIVIASVAYIAAYTCLCFIAGDQKFDRERMAGLSYWYMVHYLHCMDHERYGCHYDQVIERLIPKSGSTLYRELQERRHDTSSQVFSILQDLALVRQQEEDRPDTTPPQDEDKIASNSHGAESDSNTD